MRKAHRMEIRISSDLLEHIDRLRGDTPRAQWIVSTLFKGSPELKQAAKRTLEARGVHGNTQQGTKVNRATSNEQEPGARTKTRTRPSIRSTSSTTTIQVNKG